MKREAIGKKCYRRALGRGKSTGRGGAPTQPSTAASGGSDRVLFITVSVGPMVVVAAAAAKEEEEEEEEEEEVVVKHFMIH